MNPDDLMKVAYKERGDQIRHFSTVRSALTTFLLTVSLAAFSAFFHAANNAHPFLIAAGILALFAAIFTCIRFSWLTEKAVLRYTMIWKHPSGDRTTPERAALERAVLDFDPTWGSIFARVCQDPMNWLLIIAAGAIAIAFMYRDQLKPMFEWFGVL